MQVLRSCIILNTMSGVAKVHRRRLKVEAAAAVAAAMPASFDQTPKAPSAIAGPGTAQAAADSSTSKHRKSAAAERPVIHVRAYTNTPPATPRRTTADAPAPGSLLLSSDFSDATSTLAAALTCPIEAWLAVLRALVTYDVSYALLCSASGCLCTATALQPAAIPASSMGLFRALLGQKLGYLVFSMAAGTLLSLQMEIAYSLTRATLLMVGDGELAGSLPLRAFNSPHMASSITDLWGNRWHAFLRYYFEGLGYKLADSATAAWPLVKRLVPRSTARTLVVFAMSGLLHEYLTWAAWGVITWSYMAYFMLHCLALLTEGYAAAAFPKLAAATPSWASRAWALSVMLLLAPLFTEPYRQHGYFAHTFHPLLVPVAAVQCAGQGWAAAACRWQRTAACAR
uniref:Wax synthase domain-containing protein n=1 Tax=Tetradesmus obliquus TaxID=3088 RepID=A0A383WCN1_TETOB|eukprot:jgi/Sobl393_1/6661/SZX74456.1